MLTNSKDLVPQKANFKCASVKKLTQCLVTVK